MRLAFAGFEIDRESGQLLRAGVAVPLEPRALDVLCYLAERAGRVVARDELVSEVWRVNALSEGVLATTISKLRKALGQAASAREPIETVRGRGYRLRAQMRAESVGVPRGADPHHAPRAYTADPFVGRETVLSALAELIERAASGEGQLALISGEAGMGKTRTLNELAERARARGFAVWEGVASENASAYWPWVEVLRAARAQLGAHDFREAVPADARALLPLLPVERAAARVQAEAETQVSRFQLFDELARFLGAVSTRGACLVVLDDLHWADVASIDLLTHVAQSARRQPLLLLASVRDGDPPASAAHTSALRRLARVATRIPLIGLSVEAVSELMSTLQGGKPNAAGAAQALTARSHGNPLFVRQILGLLTQRGSRTDAATFANMKLPAAVRDVIRQRLAGLPDAAKALLNAASVVGHELDASLLAELLCQSVVETLAAIAAARQAGVLELHSVIPQRFVFSHDLLRAVLYDDLDPLTSGAFHAKLSLLLPSRAATGDARALSVLAHHALRAVPAQLETCVLHCQRAAAAARDMSSFEAAAALLSQALEKITREGGALPMRCELLCALGLDQFCAGDFRSAWQSLSQAAELAHQLADAALLTRTVCDLADWSLLGIGSRSELRERFEHALRLVADQKPELRALLLAHRAEMEVELAMAERCALLDEAEALSAQHASPEVLIEIAVCRVSLRHATRLADNRAAATRARSLMKEHPRAARTPYRSMWWLDVDFSDYYCALSACDLDGADRAAAHCRETAAGSQISAHALVAELIPIGRALGDGRLEALAQLLSRLQRQVQRLGQVSSEVGTLGFAIAGYYQVRLADARGELSAWRGDFLQLAAPSALRSSARAVVTVWLAWLSVKTSKHDGARALLAALPQEVLAQMPTRYGELGLACLLAETYCELGEREAAARLLTQLSPHAELNAVGPCADYYGAVAHYLGLLTATLGDDAAALSYFERAAALNERLRMPFQLARTERERARIVARCSM
jgi:DNA-binding winged helix-turn-helix (wHTH) protein